MQPPVLDEADEGIEGFIARNLPEPSVGWCSSVCYDLTEGKLRQ